METYFKKIGIEFDCQQCGKCCDTDGYVFVSVREAGRMARYLSLSRKEFLEQFTRKVKGNLVFKSGVREKCLFLEKGKCRVYSVRPAQCRDFPYWEEHFDDKKEIQAAQKYCQGLKAPWSSVA